MCPTLISSSVFVYNGTHAIIIKVENQQHLLNFAKLILSLQTKEFHLKCLSYIYKTFGRSEHGYDMANHWNAFQSVVIKI